MLYVVKFSVFITLSHEIKLNFTRKISQFTANYACSWVQTCFRGLVQSPCGIINVIMTLGGKGVLVHEVLQLHCQQNLVVIIQSRQASSIH